MNEPDPAQYGGHDRETWRLLISERNAMLSVHRQEAMAYAHRLSAWMIAQLFLANAAGLTIRSNEASPGSLTWFLVGIIAAMCCSLAAWWQSHLSYHNIFELSNPNALLGKEYLPSLEPNKEAAENWWFGAAVVLGIVSLLAFATGAFLRIWH